MLLKELTSRNFTSKTCLFQWAICIAFVHPTSSREYCRVVRREGWDMGMKALEYQAHHPLHLGQLTWLLWASISWTVRWGIELLPSKIDLTRSFIWTKCSAGCTETLPCLHCSNSCHPMTFPCPFPLYWNFPYKRNGSSPPPLPFVCNTAEHTSWSSLASWLPRPQLDTPSFLTSLLFNLILTLYPFQKQASPTVQSWVLFCFLLYSHHLQ